MSVHELAGKNWKMQDKKRLMRDEIISGFDELGVLLAGHEKGAYWLGSHLDIHTARKLAPYNGATTLQVTSAVLAGLVWAMENPHRGLVEPEEMDFERCLAVAGEYWGPRVGVFHRLDPAGRPGPIVRGRPGHQRPLAVQEHPRDLNRQSPGRPCARAGAALILRYQYITRARAAQEARP